MSKRESEKTLGKLGKKIRKLEKRQAEILERLDHLQPSSQLAGKKASEPARAGALPEGGELFERTVEFLDQFRAGEALGEVSLGAWIEVCEVDSLRGALRTVQMREGMHARLLEQRIKELGGTARAEIPEAVFEGAMTALASREATDADKLAAFMARFPNIDDALKPIVEMADQLDADPETQSLLRTICQDERSTLECLAQACQDLAG